MSPRRRRTGARWLPLLALLPACGGPAALQGAVPVVDDGARLSLPLTPGETLILDRNPFALRVEGPGGVQIETAPADPTMPSGVVVRSGGTWSSATRVVGSEALAGRLRLRLSRGDPTLPPILLDLAPDGAVLHATLSLPGGNPDEMGFVFALDPGVHWYGLGELGAERYRDPYVPSDAGAPIDPQPWPLETGALELVPLRTRDRFNILCPWWVASTGAGVFVDSYGDLALHWNRPWPGRFALTQMLHPPTRSRNGDFAIDLVLGANLVEAERTWFARDWPVKGRWDPGLAPPPDAMIRGPVWSTWAQYLWGVDETAVRDTAAAVVSGGYPYSVLEIDDRWQATYGETRFDPVKFPDPARLVGDLHAQGWAVSLWIQPFVDKDAEGFSEARTRGDFVGDGHGALLTRWWDALGPAAGLVDFSSPRASAWFRGLLLDPVRNAGIDGYKFDAGEAEFFPEAAALAEGVHPNQYEDLYAAFARTIPLYEMRSGWFAQREGRIHRLFDKDPEWGRPNGMGVVLLQTLTLGLLGYPYLLPDMVGSNITPEEELLVRWSEMNAFLPMMQLSIQPWRYSPEAEGIVRAMTWAHQALIPEIRRLLDEARRTETPVVRPLFWQYPDDAAGYVVDDEFLLGDGLLVCPVIEKGVRSRSVYLPRGTWRDYWGEETFVGPSSFRVSAPLGRPPVFVRSDA